MARSLRRARVARAVAACVAVLLAAACGDDGPAYDRAGPCGRTVSSGERIDGYWAPLSPIVEIAPPIPGNTYRFDLAEVAPGGVAEASFAVLNSGEVVLAVTRLTWVYTPADPAAERDAPALTCTYGADEIPCDDPGALPACVAAALGRAPGPAELAALPVRVRYRRLDAAPRRASLVVDSDNREGAITLDFVAEPLAPRLRAEPARLVFTGGQRGDRLDRTLIVVNAGTADLTVTALELDGDPEFEVAPEDGPLPWVLAPNTSRFAVVTLERATAAARSGALRVRAGEPTSDTALVALVAEAVPARLAVEPTRLALEAGTGTEASGTVLLRAIGEEPVRVTAAALDERRSAPAFRVVDAPSDLTLAPGETSVVTVVYAPTDAPGGPPDQGVLVVASDDFEPRVEVALSGRALPACARAVAHIEEIDGASGTVPLQTNLHLVGDESWAPGGDLLRFEWTVEGPEGDAGVFVPSPTFPNPTYEVNLAGVYRFCLSVQDGAAEAAECAPACVNVAAVPDDTLHVELLWRTPGDPDETDTGPFAGTDLDLHLAHPDAPSDPAAPDRDGDGAPDPWFDPLLDVFWGNPHPAWGTGGPEDDPGLDRDDRDGGGPEIVNLAAPEPGTAYRLAVHHREDHEYGPADATVRVWIDGALAWEGGPVRLEREDLWCVATLAWPGGVVTPCTAEGGGPRVTPGYPTPVVAPGPPRAP